MSALQGRTGFSATLGVVHTRAPVHPAYRFWCWLSNLPCRVADFLKGY